ncbi:MAG: helix-turn-helix domain-containing protein [Nitratireductor sp.]
MKPSKRLSSIDLFRRAAQIKARLAEKGFNLSDVDRKSGLTRCTAINTLRNPHAKGEAAIAKVLGVEPASLWPERYDGVTGERLSPQPRVNYDQMPNRRQLRKINDRQSGRQQTSEAA